MLRAFSLETLDADTQHNEARPSVNSRLPIDFVWNLVALILVAFRVNTTLEEGPKRVLPVGGAQGKLDI